MSDLFWVRSKYEEPLLVQDSEKPTHILRALRSDGQLFAVWIDTDSENKAAIRRYLRLGLDGMIDDPQTPPRVDEETGETFPSQCPIDAYKGMPGWVEEENALIERN